MVILGHHKPHFLILLVLADFTKLNCAGTNIFNPLRQVN